MSRIYKHISNNMPTGFLWRLTILNILVVVLITSVSGWTIYKTACFLAAEVGDLDTLRQQLFNRTLFNYLWILMVMVTVGGVIIHFYLVRRFIKPIQSLIQSTKEMRFGYFPKPVKVYKNDEIGQLAKQYNELIKQLKVNEEQRNRLVTDISHEVRTPLSNLNGYLLALKDGDIKADRALFSALYQESSRLSQMIEQLDELKEWDYLSAQLVVKKEMYDIKLVLLQCISMFKRKLDEKGIQIQVEIESYQMTIHVMGIQQVISNLLENAINYYEGDGPIKVVGEKRETDYRISVAGPSKTIPEGERDNIFRRFYRLDGSRSRMTGGSGLGLAISKEIIDRHHGKIGLNTTSESNVFWVILPN